jgi:hypothetical protein
MRARWMPIAAIAVAPIVGVLLMSTTVIGIATPTTTTTTPLVLAMPTTTRPSSAPTTSTTRPSTTTPLPTIPPAIVQPTTTAPPTITAQPSTTTAAVPTAPATTAPAPATTTTQLLIHDVFVSAVDVGQVEQDVDSRMPLVAGKSSTWVRVATHYAGGGDAGTIDGALLVERDGQPDDVLLADNGPIGIGATGAVFEFQLEPPHYSAGTVSMTFTLFRPDGTPVDDSPANNSMTKVVEFHTARNPRLVLFADPQLDPQRLAEIAGELSETMLDSLPVAAVDVQVLPVPVTDSAGPDDPNTWPEVLGQMVWNAESGGDPDQPVIVARVYDPPDPPGDDLLTVDAVSFDGQNGLYDLPGAYADRFDGIDYCSALDALAVPCSRRTSA